jgi:hypothetical protein
VDLVNTWQQFGIEAGAFERFSADSIDTVTKHALNTTLVAIEMWWYNGSCRIVVFRRINNDWSFFGFVDIPVERLEPVEINLRQSGSRQWVVLTSAEAEGTGIFAKTVTWYEVTKAGLKQVLTYPGEGHLAAGDLFMPLGVSRAVKSTFRGVAVQGGRIIVRVQFSVTFGFFTDGKDVEDLLPEETEIATFQEDAGRTFKLVPSPRLDTVKLSTLYDIARVRLTVQDFLNLEYKQLQQIAAGGNMAKKIWLRDFLAQCKRFQLCSDTKGLSVK